MGGVAGAGGGLRGGLAVRGLGAALKLLDHSAVALDQVSHLLLRGRDLLLRMLEALDAVLQ